MKKEVEKSEAAQVEKPKEKQSPPSKETGGPKGKEPTRYGDWEVNGKCVDF